MPQTLPRPLSVGQDCAWIGLGNWRAAWDGQFIYSPEPFRVLYDQRNDPHELNNLNTAPKARGKESACASCS
jgi:arylsulfatase A-like enzyme